LSEQSFAGSIDKTQTAFWIESKNRDFNLPHNRAQERRCFKGAQALQAQSFAKRVDFEKDFSQCIVSAGAPRADRVIAFA
jgi:hypothetical protein